MELWNNAVLVHKIIMYHNTSALKKHTRGNRNNSNGNIYGFLQLTVVDPRTFIQWRTQESSKGRGSGGGQSMAPRHFDQNLP